jgi:hypothetical protein
MSLFGNLTTEGLEQTEDRVGGFQPLETDAYTGEIKAFYATKSAGGANAVNIILALEGGREYRETIYVTNRNGENFYLNQNDKSKKVPLPGFVIAEDICLVTVEKPLSAIAFEDKVMNIYDPDAKREVPKSVPMAVELIGKTVTLGIVNQLENKSEKQGDEYVPIADTRNVNFTDKVFHTGTKMTTVEARNGAEKAVFFDAWVERNKGNIRDKRTIKDGAGGNAGQAGRPGGGAPQAGGAPAGPKKSLFGG